MLSTSSAPTTDVDASSRLTRRKSGSRSGPRPRRSSSCEPGRPVSGGRSIIGCSAQESSGANRSAPRRRNSVGELPTVGQPRQPGTFQGLGFIRRVFSSSSKLFMLGKDSDDRKESLGASRPASASLDPNEAPRQRRKSEVHDTQTQSPPDRPPSALAPRRRLSLGDAACAGGVDTAGTAAVGTAPLRAERPHVSWGGSAGDLEHLDAPAPEATGRVLRPILATGTCETSQSKRAAPAPAPIRVVGFAIHEDSASDLTDEPAAKKAIWDPLGVLGGGGDAGAQRAARAAKNSLERTIQTRILAYAFRTGIFSSLGALPDLALNVARAADKASTPLANAAATLRGEAFDISAFLAASGVTTSGDEHAAHFVTMLLVGTAIGAASTQLAETLLEYLLDRAPQDAGAAASDAAASAEATSKKAASLRERLHALVFPPLSQEQQTEADSPASPCPVRAYYAVRRVASGISSATLLGAVQLAVLAALAAVCPPLVQAAPDKGILVAETITTVAAETTRPLNSAVRKRAVDIVRSSVASTGDGPSLAPMLIVGAEIAAVLAVEGICLALGIDPVYIK